MPNYIDNKEFFAKLKERKDEENESGEPQPISNYLGLCFLKIATNLSQKKNFANYTFVEEMIGDSVEQCIKYCDNFYPSLSTSPFSYFTQIVYYTFLRRIKKENTYYDFLSDLKEDKKLQFSDSGILMHDFDDAKKRKEVKRQKNKKKMNLDFFIL